MHHDTSLPHDQPLPAIVRPAVDLAQLAREIQRLHQSGQTRHRAALQDFLHAGRLLLQARQACKRGDWGDWHAALGLSRSSVSRYMRLAAKCATVAHLDEEALAEEWATLCCRGSIEEQPRQKKIPYARAEARLERAKEKEQEEEEERAEEGGVEGRLEEEMAESMPEFLEGPFFFFD